MESNITYLFEENSYTDLTLYQFGYEKCAPLLSCGPAKHNNYLIHYIISGKGTYSVLGNSYTVQKGEAFLIFPDTITQYTSDRIDPWTYIWIEFGGLKVERFLTDAGLSPKTPIYSPLTQESSAELEALMKNSLIYHDNPLKLMGNMYHILETLIRTTSINRPPKNNTLQEFYVHEALLFIERHYKENITVSQLADWCNINRSYFGKIFRNTIFMTPQKYIIKYRMNVACSLLRDTNENISNIASAVGYENQMNFSRAFRKELGMSPSEWRKKATCKPLK